MWLQSCHQQSHRPMPYGLQLRMFDFHTNFAEAESSHIVTIITVSSAVDGSYA